MGVDHPFEDPVAVFRLAGKHGVMEVESQVGTNYSLVRDSDLATPPPAPLFTVPGTGQTLYLTDPQAYCFFSRAFYRVVAERD